MGGVLGLRSGWRRDVLRSKLNRLAQLDFSVHILFVLSSTLLFSASENNESKQLRLEHSVRSVPAKSDPAMFPANAQILTLRAHVSSAKFIHSNDTSLVGAP
jgi:hypothetical protein